MAIKYEAGINGFRQLSKMIFNFWGILKHRIALFRVHQWIKNLFIFLPLFFGLKLTDLHLLARCGISFISFCFISSAVYVFNDLFDLEMDRLHPKKKFRPIAAGTISNKEAVCEIIILLVLGIGLITVLKSVLAILIISGYLLINFLYTIKLKNIAILDVFLIAVGFIVRIFMGGVVCNIVLSHWIVIMTFLLALFLGFAKRRDDLLLFEKTGEKARSNISDFTLNFINQAMTIMASVVIVAYTMYTLSPEVISRTNPNLYFTTVFVIWGVLRYLQLTLVHNKSGNPTKIVLVDRYLQFIILGWILLFATLIYF
jgi:4-hydroxybenzoate polyprenyltransferase